MADLQTNLQRLETNSDEISSLVTDISDAIVAKGGTLPSNAGLRSFPTAIETIPSGSGSLSMDVIFYDYDGSVVKNYSAEEFADVTALPDNPTHTGLTAQGWNWTLSDAKTYVAQFGKLDVGQQYVTSDGATKIYITLDGEMLSPVLKLEISSGMSVSVDWGDGSSPSTLNSSTQSEKHDYAAPGDYVISISATSGSYTIPVGFLAAGTSSSPLDIVYLCNVTKIELGANVASCKFKDCRQMETISIPNGTSILESGFHSCYNLKHINIPADSSIRSGLFAYCYNMSTISIGNGISQLPYQMFAECTGFLKRVIIPNSCLTIDAATFSNCNVVEIVFGNGITEIPSSLLYQRSSVKYVTLGNAVTLIGPSAFYGTSISEITLPDTLINIGNSAFRNCYSLKKVIGGQNVEKYGDYCFSTCKTLTSFTIPDTVTNINTNTFYQSQLLSRVTIGSGLTKLGNGAFQNCSALYSITIPSTITELGTYVLNSCSEMKYIRFESTTPPTVAGSSSFSGVSTSTLIYVPAESINAYKSGTNYPNPNNYTYIGYKLFASGETLPTDISGYNVTWYATVSDWSAETNPITVGNGNDVYAKFGSVVSVTRTVDFVNNTSQIDSEISGLSVYSNMKRCNVADDGTINAYDGDAGYVEDGTNGQVMVYVPKFYYKLDVSQTGDLDGVNIRKGRWTIADTKRDNTYKLHPAFLADDGVTELNYFLYSAFDGNVQADDCLSSISGVYPTASIKRSAARTYATNRGAGWYQIGIKQTMAIQMLFAVEYGFNSQTALGYGIVNASGAYTTGSTTGSTSSGSTSSKTTAVNYRGIENLWGNIWKWVDGINFQNTTPYVCDTFAFEDDTSTGYTQIGFDLPAEGYTTALGYDSSNDWILLPSESSSSQDVSGPIGDGVWSNTGWTVALLGGSWVHNTDAGIFCWSGYDTSSTATPYFCGRIMYIPS